MITAVSLGLITGPAVPPPWVRDMSVFKDVAASHRRALLAKEYAWYSQFGWAEDPGYCPESYDYIWPVS
jgi:hypothetical protein